MSDPASTLDLALDYLTWFPGRYLFPIAAGKKFPPREKDNLDKNASNDFKQIRKWHKKYWGCNWGVALSKSHLLAVDVDCKKGRQGRQTYDVLNLCYGFPRTEMATTPSGGEHHLYQYKIKHTSALGKNGFGEGIDSPGYILIPGCKLDTGGEYIAVASPPIQPAPAWFYEVLAAAKSKVTAADQTTPAVELDQPDNVEWAIDFLKHDAPPSIEGQGGEKTTFDVAGILKDHGISEQTAVDLMGEHYNMQWDLDRSGYCEPLWSMDETPPEDSLPIKIHNAYVYKKETQPGAATAEAQFAEDPLTADQIAELKASDDGMRERERSYGVVFLNAHKVTLHNVDYIWRGRLARGKHSLIAGEAGEGKSQIAMYTAARVSTGGQWPDGGNAPQGNVVILSAEDDPEDTLVPRLIAAGANLEYIKIVKMVRDAKGNHKFSLEQDMEKLKVACKRLGNVVLIIIDPVSSYMGGKLDGKANTAVRHVLDPLSDLAADLRCAILSITHFRKGTEGPKAVHRIMDSIAFGAAPRATFGVYADPTDVDSYADPRVMLLFKTNLPDMAEGLKYHIEETTGGTDSRTNKPIKTLRIVWDGTTDLTADAVQRMTNEQHSTPRLDEAVAFIETTLADSARPVADVQIEATRVGIKDDTLRKALRKLGIKARIREGSATKHQPGVWEYPGI
jgi:hypothetical protein